MATERTQTQPAADEAPVAPASAPRTRAMRLPKTTGALSGVLIIVLGVVLSLIFNQARAGRGSDETAPGDYRFGLSSRT